VGAGAGVGRGRGLGAGDRAAVGDESAAVARLARSEEPPRYRRAPVVSKLDPFEPLLRRLLEEWPQIKAPRATEFLREEYGYDGSVDLVKRRLRELRPFPASRCFPRCATRSDRQLREGAVPLTSVQTCMVEPNDGQRPRAKMGGSAWGTRGRTYGHCSRFPSARRRVAAVSLSRKSREATPSQATRHVEPYRTLARGTRLSGAGLVCSGSHPAIAERRTLNSRGAVDSWAWAPPSPFGSTAATNTEGT
jgi:hypothetical protein